LDIEIALREWFAMTRCALSSLYIPKSILKNKNTVLRAKNDSVRMYSAIITHAIGVSHASCFTVKFSFRVSQIAYRKSKITQSPNHPIT